MTCGKKGFNGCKNKLKLKMFVSLYSLLSSSFMATPPLPVTSLSSPPLFLSSPSHHCRHKPIQPLLLSTPTLDSFISSTIDPCQFRNTPAINWANQR